MVQKDYILRMIEQMGAIVAELRRRILGGEAVAFDAEKRDMATAAGLDLSLALVLEPDAILSLMAPDGRPEPMRLWLAAELVYLEGLSLHTAGEEEQGRAMLAKARVLYSVLNSGPLPSAIPETNARLEEIDHLIGS